MAAPFADFAPETAKRLWERFSLPFSQVRFQFLTISTSDNKKRPPFAGRALEVLKYV